MKREVIDNFSLPDDKLVIINNGINVNKFDGCAYDVEVRRKYAMDHERIVFFVGRVVNEKGVAVLVEAMPRVISQYNDVKFVIVGKGPQKEYLQSRVYELGIGGKVYFTGYLEDNDLRVLYKCVDVAVYPSLYEPFGIVAIEAMLAGIPVVASDVGGLGEIIENDVDGKKCLAGNSNSLAECILDILKDSVKAKNMMFRAREKVLKQFNWDVLERDYMRVYEEIVNEVKKSEWKQHSVEDINI